MLKYQTFIGSGLMAQDNILRLLKKVKTWMTSRDIGKSLNITTKNANRSLNLLWRQKLIKKSHDFSYPGRRYKWKINGTPQKKRKKLTKVIPTKVNYQ